MLQESERLFQAMVAGDRRALSRAITLIESNHPAHRDIGIELIEKSLPWQGRAKRVGVTGVPGAGKSTLIDDLGMFLVTQKNKVAVLAIDPSSQKSGGSILGDKTRMARLAVNDQAFIRPSPAGAQLGGVARRTPDVCLLLDAAGYDVIIIETVGIGQSEVTVHSLVDFLFLCVITGAGDEVQGIKRGIMELADTILIMKADGENLPLARKAKQDYENIMHIWPAHYSFWQTNVFLYSHNTPNIIADNEKNNVIDNVKNTEQIPNDSSIANCRQIWQTVEDFFQAANKKAAIEKKRLDQREFWLQESLRNEILDRFFSSQFVAEKISEIRQAVTDSLLSSRRASKTLVDTFLAEK